MRAYWLVKKCFSAEAAEIENVNEKIKQRTKTYKKQVQKYLTFYKYYLIGNHQILYKQLTIATVFQNTLIKPVSINKNCEMNERGSNVCYIIKGISPRETPHNLDTC